MNQPTAEEIWCDDWPIRHLERIKATGVSSVREFLSRSPGTSYHKLVRQLGNFVAPMQLQRLQFDEAKSAGRLRDAAMDMMVRVIAARLKRGWRRGGHHELNRAGACADFTGDLCIAMNDRTIEILAKAIWTALEQQDPPPEWVPKSVDDPLIRKAFDAGWDKQTGQL